jgi:hypothetical protein
MDTPNSVASVDKTNEEQSSPVSETSNGFPEEDTDLNPLEKVDQIK